METLFILHGWGSSKNKWQKVKELLEEEGIEVIIPEIPGLDKDISRPWNLSDYVNWFNKLTLKKSSFFLLGHSFGGRVAIKFSAFYPQKLKGLILVSAAGIKKKPSPLFSFVKIFKRLSFLPGFSFFRKMFYKFVVRKTDYLQAEGNLKETFKKITQEDIREYLPQIKVTTLIVWGKKDKITPLEDAYLMKKEIKDSKLELLDNIGHAPYIENPEIIARKIVDFIKKKEQ